MSALYDEELPITAVTDAESIAQEQVSWWALRWADYVAEAVWMRMVLDQRLASVFA